MYSIYLERLLQPYHWPASVWCLLFTSIVTFFVQVTQRPAVAKGAPKADRSSDWPIVGALQFYWKRYEFWVNALERSSTGNFSFYIGKKQLVGVSGPEGRKVFFENKGLSLAKAHAALFDGQPTNAGQMDELEDLFHRNLAQMIRKESLEKIINQMTIDTRAVFDELLLAPASRAEPNWKVTNPFDTLPPVIFQHNIRTLGAHDIADDPKLLHQIMTLFEGFERGASTARVIFPWLPTPRYLMRMYKSTKLYLQFAKLVKEREAGKYTDDALQHLIDQKTGMREIATFEIGIIFAAQISTAVNNSQLPYFLCENLEWLASVKEEVDGIIAKYRCRSDQSSADVLSTLDLSCWQSEFPMILLSLRESIRLSTMAAIFRLNHSSADIPIGDGTEVLPKDAFAVLHFAEVHMNPGIYKDPEVFDPTRYLPERAEDRQVAHAYAGWGSGRHPCVGQKLAELVTTIVMAHMIAMLDFEISEKDGTKSTRLPIINKNAHDAGMAVKQENPVFIRYKARI